MGPNMKNHHIHYQATLRYLDTRFQSGARLLPTVQVARSCLHCDLLRCIVYWLGGIGQHWGRQLHNHSVSFTGTNQ